MQIVLRVRTARWFIVLAVTPAAAGCGIPLAAVDGRSLTDRPVPAGPMAMLPPILSPVVQYQTPATAFSRNMLRDRQRAGLNVQYDDLGGRLGSRTATTQAARQMITVPGPAASLPSSRSGLSRLTLEERYQYWQQRGFATVA